MLLLSGVLVLVQCSYRSLPPYVSANVAIGGTASERNRLYRERLSTVCALSRDGQVMVSPHDVPLPLTPPTPSFSSQSSLLFLLFRLFSS